MLSFDKVNKIITVLAPDTEITIQNLLNSIREYEDELTSLDIPRIVSCAGKEPLGGGVVVGLTLTLLDDWQLAFEARPGPIYTQCKVSGGNIVATNTNGSIYPTAFTQVLITASSSATQSDLAAIQYASFGGGVSIDITATNNYATGTEYPSGNQEYPVNNLANAITIANLKGFKTLFIAETMTLGVGTISNFKIVGRSHVSTVITIDSATVCSGITIENANITGTLDGGTHIYKSVVGTINYVNGHIHSSGLYGTITLGGNADAVIENCHTVDQDSPVIIDMNVSGQDLAMPGYSGLATITNFNDSSGEIGIGLDHGAIILTDTILDASSIIIAGNGILYNNTSLGSDIINTDGLMNKTIIAETISESYIHRIYIDVVNGTAGTTAPLGNEKHPVNNLPDAITVAVRENIDRLDISGSLTITTGQDVSGYTLISDRSLGNVVTVNSGAITVGTYFENLTISGTMGGPVRYTTCVLGTINDFDGGAKNSLLTGDIIFTSTNNNYLTECDTYVTSSGYVSLHTNQASLNIMRGRGRWGIFDKSSTNTTAIDLVSGFVYVDSTCISGTVNVGGIGSVEDNSSVGCQVNQGAINNEYMADAVWNDDISGRYSINSSATALKALTYDALITINTVSGTVGTSWPIGTRYSPVNNLTDALTIMNRGNIDRLLLEADLIVDASADISGFLLETHGLMGTTVTLDEGCRADNTAFRYVNLEGTLTQGDSLLIENCSILSLENFTGIMNNVAFGQGSEISLAYWAEIIQGTAGGDPTNEVELDIGSASLNMSGWTGSLKLKGKTGVNRVTVNCSSGNIIIDSTCVSGTIQLLGVGQVEQDNSGPNCTVDTDAFISRASIAVAVWDENLAAHLNDASTGHALMHQTYEQTLFIDTVNGTDGTIYPAGIRQEPVKTLADALVLINTYELNSVHVIGSLLISGGEDISGLTFLSDRSIGNSVTVSSAITNNTYFENLTVSGTMAGTIRYTTCVLGTINGFDGGAKNSLLTSDINITGNGANYFTECDTYITDSSAFKKLIISDKLVNIIRCRGNYEIAGKTSTGTTSIDLVAGIIKIDADCTAGEVFVAGIGEVIDNSALGCTVVDAALSRSGIVDDTWHSLASSYTISGTMGSVMNNVSYSGEYDTALNDIKTNLDRVLGLSQENYELSDMVYTTYSGIQLLESSTIRIYSNPLSVGGVTDIVATYNIESEWTADQLTNYKVTRI